mmetsp:Transcript_55566/g.129347  ORF Transcript_55566/g.129347 Transcript_55566/m.129347 type:complete len:98 (-) Transcript_55566:224-517(-)
METAGASPPASPAASGNRSIPRNVSRHSILSGQSGRGSRVDSFGNAIEKGAKTHKCSFPDEKDPNCSVEEKIEVTAYKGPCLASYGDEQPGCSCNLM